MIDKFNFYDVYGYLLPGLVLFGVFWLPFGLLFHAWPSGELSSAILTLAFSYVAGHLMQISVRSVLPPTIRDASGKKRYPSNVLLDVDNSILSDRLKSRISELCDDNFSLQVAPNKGSGDPNIRDISDKRWEAFSYARTMLLQAGKKSYGEQFEGLYALMGGIVFAFSLSVGYFTGWSIAFLLAVRTEDEGNLASSVYCSVCGTLILSGLALVFAIISQRATTRRRRTDSVTAVASAAKPDRKSTFEWLSKRKTWEWLLAGCVVLITILAGGLCAAKVLAANHGLTTNNGNFPAVISIIAVGFLIATIRSYGLYLYFAEEFAKAIWKEFANFKMKVVSEAE